MWRIKILIRSSYMQCTGDAGGEIRNWSLLGVKGLSSAQMQTIMVPKKPWTLWQLGTQKHCDRAKSRNTDCSFRPMATKQSEAFKILPGCIVWKNVEPKLLTPVINSLGIARIGPENTWVETTKVTRNNFSSASNYIHCSCSIFQKMYWRTTRLGCLLKHRTLWENTKALNSVTFFISCPLRIRGNPNE